MRKFAAMLLMALFAAASIAITYTPESLAASHVKDKKDDKGKKDAKAKDKKDDKGKAKAKGKKKGKAKGKKKDVAGKCGTMKYYDKKTKKCADATASKK